MNYKVFIWFLGFPHDQPDPNETKTFYSRSQIYFLKRSWFRKIWNICFHFYRNLSSCATQFNFNFCDHSRREGYYYYNSNWNHTKIKVRLGGTTGQISVKMEANISYFTESTPLEKINLWPRIKSFRFIRIWLVVWKT